MAEYVESSDIEIEPVFKVSFGYEDYYLSKDAAQQLRAELNMFLSGT